VPNETFAKGNITLTNVADDAGWKPVLCVEDHFDRHGLLTSVINHREKTFEQRKQELEESNA